MVAKELSDNGTIRNFRNYVILVLILSTGLRTIEVSRANIEDVRINGNNKILLIQGKGHLEKDAYVKLTDEVCELIQIYLNKREV